MRPHGGLISGSPCGPILVRFGRIAMKAPGWEGGGGPGPAPPPGPAAPPGPAWATGTAPTAASSAADIVHVGAGGIRFRERHRVSVGDRSDVNHSRLRI